MYIHPAYADSSDAYIYIYIYIYLFCACDCAYVFFLSFFKVILPPFCLSHRLKKYKKWVLHAFDNHHKKNALSSRKKQWTRTGIPSLKRNQELERDAFS